MAVQGYGGNIMAMMTHEDHREELIKFLMESVPCNREDAINIYIPDFERTMEERRIEADAIQYQVDRSEKYPTIEDVVVALAEKEEGDSTMWDEISEKRQEIKIKYPKP